MKSEMVAGLTFDQFPDESSQVLAPGSALYAPAHAHLPTLHRHYDPVPACTAGTPPLAGQTVTFPDAMAAIQPVPVPSPPSIAGSLASPSPTGQFYQMHHQPTPVRHTHWQPQAWPSPSPMSCTPAPSPGSSQFVYPQATMATLPAPAACFEALSNPCQRFDASAATLTSGLSPVPPMFGMTLQAQPGKMLATDYRLDGTAIHKVRGDGRKCRKVYGMENKDKWCTQCRWKKACVRFVD